MTAAEGRAAALRRAAALFEEIVDLAPEEQAERLRSISDPAERHQVERLLAADGAPASGEFPSLGLAAISGWTPADPPGGVLPAERIGAWRLVRPLGRGGMGDVFIAERGDGQYEQRAALKLLRRGIDSEEVVGRFLRERQILAQLRHPSIAQLLDGGVAADGRPYFVLELVEGEPIHDACAHRRLGLEARVQLVLEVAAAVDFAHRNLVVHRDLKPGNVFVAADGAVKLLDFGIAKLLEPDASDRTRSDLRLFTPQYATPEQLAGGPVTTATDVYALGLLLYELVVGAPAFPEPAGGSSAAQAAATRETVARPSARVLSSPAAAAARAPLADDSPGARRALSRRLAGDVDAIVGKALRPEAERRYASVAALADDLRRFLAHRPVAARGGQLGYRLGKLARRHRGAVAAAALLAVAIAGGIVATLRQARVAELERQRAERRFGEVRQLANRFLFEFEESIRDLAGATAARESVARTAREYLDRLASEAGDDFALLNELAQANLKLGDLEGHPRLANLGRPADARRSYARALDLGERMAALRPRDLGGLARARTAELRLGDLDRDAGAADAAEKHYGRGLELAEAALALDAADVEARRQRGQSVQRLGALEMARGDYTAALPRFESYVRSTGELLAADPGSKELTRDLLVANIYLGDVYDEWGKAAEALPVYERALAIAVDRRRAFPGAESDRDWGVAAQRALIGLRRLGRHAEALALARETLAWTAGAAAADPANALLERDLAESYSDVGRELGALGDWAAARDWFRRSRQSFERLSQADEESAEIVSYLASARYFEAEALFELGERRGAAALVGRVRTAEESLAAESPDDAELRERLAATLRLGARIALAGGAPPPAIVADLERALGLEEALLAQAGESAERRAALDSTRQLLSEARGAANAKGRS